jgi:hypothetical protein
MNPYILKNNSEFLEYLVRTAQVLRSNNHVELAEELERAGLFANGSPSEFLHEAQTALQSVTSAKPAGIELGEVHAVISQIKEAFRKVGGA